MSSPVIQRDIPWRSREWLCIFPTEPDISSSASTAQLLLACKVKADPDSQPMRRLEDASNAVRKATENLVKAAQSALDNNAEGDHLDLSEGDVGGVVQVNICNRF